MTLYVSDIEVSYKDTIIGHLVNSGTSDLLLHVVQCWRAYAADEEKQALTMVMYCSGMIYKYYSHLGFLSINTQQGRENIHHEIFNNIPHFIKNRLHVNFIQDGFVMYENKVIIRKRKTMSPIPDYMIPLYCCQKN